MNLQLSDILKALTTLTRSERGKLTTALKALGTTATTEKREISVESDKLLAELFYQNVVDTLKNHTGAAATPYPIFIRTSTHKKKFNEALAGLNVLLVRLSGKDKPSRVLRMSFYRLYANVIARAIIRHSNPLSIGTMLNYHERFAAELEAEFPGYIETGLFHVILTRLGKS